MNHRDRFFSTIHYQPVDRPASWLGLPVPSAKPAMMKYFERKVVFCDGVNDQNLLVKGKPEEVAKNVLELKEVFPTGLIISLSHEAILPDIPPAIIKTLFNALKKLNMNRRIPVSKRRGENY